jgi:hypothetical protein
MNNMKRFKFYYSGLAIMLLFLASFFSSPSTAVFSASGDPPSITIDSPKANTLLSTTAVVISGTYADTSTPLLTASENSNPISDSTTNASEWKITNNGTNGNWSFTKELSEGTHTITIQITDQSTNTTNTTPISVSFTIDTKRPYISETGIVFKGTSPYAIQSGDTLETIAQAKLGDPSLWTDIAEVNGLKSPYISDTPAEGVVIPGDNIYLPVTRSGEDLTSIPVDAFIKMILVDDKPMDQLASKIGDGIYNPLKVMLDTTQIEGTTSIIKNSGEAGKYVYDVFFTPSTPLALNTAYLAYLDPSLVDDSNGPVYAKFFKFTTKSDMDNFANPHGNYQLNTNMCAGCHSSHDGFDNVLEGGSYELTFNVGLHGNTSESYCMSCHDGTLNAPIIDKMNKQYHHDSSANNPQNAASTLKEANSCTSCHNPHTDWTEQNPNLLKDHYVYTHNAGDSVSPQIIDSLDTSCDACHDDNTIDLKNTISGKYELFSYKKSMTATGAISDYSLCLRCHNTAKKDSNSLFTDIEQYYNDSSSGHSFTLPSDDGGNKLNGPMPCAECHETHGSDNMMMLRDKLGNVITDDPFVSSGDTWDAANERQFCLKCHNNKTEIYGKIGAFNNQISGHELSNLQACSECHGTGSNAEEKALSAAHAPKKNP